MRNATAFGKTWLCGADVETLVELRRVASHHFPAQPLGKPHTKGRFARGRRPYDGYQRRTARNGCATGERFAGTHGKGDGARGQTGKSAQIRRSKDCPELVGVQASLMCVVGLQIIVVRKSQFDVGPLKLRRQGLERIGSANRRNRGAVERFFSGSGQTTGSPSGTLPFRIMRNCNATTPLSPSRTDSGITENQFRLTVM